MVRAAKVIEQLDFPRPFVGEVLKELVDGGLDDLAAEVEAKLPLGCLEPWSCDWSQLGARALVGGAFQFVTVLLRPHGDRVIRDRYIAAETRALLRELGRDAAAAAFRREFNSTLADDGSENWLEEDVSEETFEDDGSEETMEGRLLAKKLRECGLLAE
jgi:hypothetical protein